ncbi:transglycosylase SLT domain-containing protein [Dongshaea marina]|uniref:transglycosylase SLT domain-containing protein n=1 Tax=Dongshaea marina TaxID=2047966 RepID=UPI000D3EDA68|nr:hypothetical protein [Dongshaea marina]
MLKRSVIVLVLLTLLSSCSSLPDNPHNICDIFRQNRSWYDAAMDMNHKWGVPVQVPMAMMFQESSFRDDAKPPMDYFLGFIPIGRVSSAYGYAQAMDPAWEQYQRETGNYSGDRDDFADAIDFMGWYITKTNKINKVSKWNAYAQYLNYHEGWGGYKRGSYRNKAWLIKTAKRVQKRAETYGAQFRSCQEELSHGWLWRLFFG